VQARDRAMDSWFAKIGSGQVRLPRFQRFEAWGPREVTDLLQTVIEELPAGASLILQIGDSSPFSRIRLLASISADSAAAWEFFPTSAERSRGMGLDNILGVLRSHLSLLPPRTGSIGAIPTFVHSPWPPRPGSRYASSEDHGYQAQ